MLNIGSLIGLLGGIVVSCMLVDCDFVKLTISGIESFLVSRFLQGRFGTVRNVSNYQQCHDCF